MLIVSYINKKKPSSTLDLNAPDDSLVQELTETGSQVEAMVSPRIQVETVRHPQRINYDLPQKGGPVLLLSLNGRTSTHSIDNETTKIGRHDTNAIQINEQTVTGSHAIIRKIDSKYELEDLGSTNGTFVNGERIRKRVLISGDRIRFGNIEATVKI
jgi:hypothetical protein